MKLYLAPTASLKLIRYLRSTNGEDGLGGTPLRKRRLIDAVSTVRAMQELDAVAQRWLEHAGCPTHAFVNDRSNGTSTKRLITHVYSEEAPHGAIVDLGHGICACSPHFTFMQLAAHVDLVEAVRIAMELCGTYSQWRLNPGSMGDPYYQSFAEDRSCTFDVPPAMRLSRVRAFVDRQKGHRGAVGARAALRWALEGSASPMETAIYLLLCLPKRLGGYGLPKPVLNPKLIISNPGGTMERYPDLYWSGASIDVEYNSDSKHSGEWSRYRDSKREIEFVVANVRVLPLTRPQVMNVDEFHAFAQGLRRMLGLRSRGFDLDWEHRRARLRTQLLLNWD